MNPIAMEMMVRAKQMEIDRKVALKHRLEKAQAEHRTWVFERSVLALMILVVPVSLLGIFILM